MKPNFKQVMVVLGLTVMTVSPAGIGCRGHTAPPASEQSTSDQQSSGQSSSDTSDQSSTGSSDQTSTTSSSPTPTSEPLTNQQPAPQATLRTAIGAVNKDCSTGDVELIVTVTDLNNNPMEGFTSVNFQLAENSVPQTITGVSGVLSPVPASVTALLDYTASMYNSTMGNQIPNVEDASNYFVGLLNHDDEAAVIKFATKSYVMQNFTNDQGLLSSAITAPPTSAMIGDNNATYLFDALYDAVNKTAVRGNNKAVIAITDGWDVSRGGKSPVSYHSLEQVVTRAMGSGVAIYPIGLGKSCVPPETRNCVHDDVLSRLSSSTGGQYYPIDKQTPTADDIKGVYFTIRKILAGQYSVKYHSSILKGGGTILLSVTVNSGTDIGEVTGSFTGCP